MGDFAKEFGIKVLSRTSPPYSGGTILSSTSRPRTTFPSRTFTRSTPTPACVTIRPKTAANINDLTITFVGSRYPRKLAEHLEKARGFVVEKSGPGVYSVKGDSITMQIIDTQELPVEENLWLAQLDNRLDSDGARRLIRELDREDRAERLAAYIDTVYTANFEVMEEVSKMSDTTTVYGKTLENAGYVTRKMILAKIEGKAEGIMEGKTEGGKKAKTEIPKRIGPGPIETIATITTRDILTQK
jgi:hypothetical protein